MVGSILCVHSTPPRPATPVIGGVLDNTESGASNTAAGVVDLKTRGTATARPLYGRTLSRFGQADHDFIGRKTSVAGNGAEGNTVFCGPSSRYVICRCASPSRAPSACRSGATRGRETFQTLAHLIVFRQSAWLLPPLVTSRITQLKSLPGFRVRPRDCSGSGRTRSRCGHSWTSA